jgi:hypothetical protein
MGAYASTVFEFLWEQANKLSDVCRSIYQFYNQPAPNPAPMPPATTNEKLSKHETTDFWEQQRLSAHQHLGIDTVILKQFRIGVVIKHIFGTHVI